MTTSFHRGRSIAAQPRGLRMLALLCLLLVATASTAQAAHIHGDWLPANAAHAGLPAAASQGQGEEHCSLCVAMHSALPASMLVSPEPVSALSRSIRLRRLHAPEKLWSFATFSRPPPVSGRTHAAG